MMKHTTTVDLENALIDEIETVARIVSQKNRSHLLKALNAFLPDNPLTPDTDVLLPLNGLTLHRMSDVLDASIAGTVEEMSYDVFWYRSRDGRTIQAACYYRILADFILQVGSVLAEFRKQFEDCFEAMDTTQRACLRNAHKMHSVNDAYEWIATVLLENDTYLQDTFKAIQYSIRHEYRESRRNTPAKR